MKVAFVGPSYPDALNVANDRINVRPPACQGDVMRAVQDGATAIGIIDGHFDFVAPVWHKELLYALSRGVPVMGAASMGALRAVECAAFGMIGIGRIYHDYRTGKRFDDADVALLHGPAELSYPPMSIPLVNVDATTSNAVALGLMDAHRATALSAAADKIFYQDRSWQHVANVAGEHWEELRPIIDQAWVDQKRCDASLLLEYLDNINGEKPTERIWTFNRTRTWRLMYPEPRLSSEN